MREDILPHKAPTVEAYSTPTLFHLTQELLEPCIVYDESDHWPVIESFLLPKQGTVKLRFSLLEVIVAKINHRTWLIETSVGTLRT